MRNQRNFYEQLEAKMPGWMAELQVPGAAVAVIENGRPIETRCFGTLHAEAGGAVTADTIFEAASLSKPVVAYAALQLVDRGLLDLDRPVLSYILDGRIPVILPMDGSRHSPLDFPKLGKLTARHILSHTTGLPNWPPNEGELAIHFQPGSRFSYSGMAYAMLQTLIEVLSGQPCSDYIQTNIFDPFGMNYSVFWWDGEKDWPIATGHDKNGEPVEKWLWTQMIAGAGLHCSTADFARFVSAVMTPKTESPYSISAELTKEMFQTQIQVNDSANWHDDWPKPDIDLNPNVGWALGWGTQQSDEGHAIWHWGDNGIYKSFVIAYPDEKSSLLIMTNSKNGDTLYERILTKLTPNHYPSIDWLNSL